MPLTCSSSTGDFPDLVKFEGCAILKRTLMFHGWDFSQYFVRRSSTTRTEGPYWAYVRGAKRNRIDRHRVELNGSGRVPSGAADGLFCRSLNPQQKVCRRCGVRGGRGLEVVRQRHASPAVQFHPNGELRCTPVRNFRSFLKGSSFGDLTGITALFHAQA